MRWSRKWSVWRQWQGNYWNYFNNWPLCTFLLIYFITKGSQDLWVLDIQNDPCRTSPLPPDQTGSIIISLLNTCYLQLPTESPTLGVEYHGSKADSGPELSHAVSRAGLVLLLGSPWALLLTWVVFSGTDPASRQLRSPCAHTVSPWLYFALSLVGSGSRIWPYSCPG